MSKFDIHLDLDLTSLEYGDFRLKENDLHMVTDQLSSIRQDVVQRLRTYFGEWFLDVTIGIDYFGEILVKNPDLGTIEGILKSTILGTPGVTTLLTFNLTQNSLKRTLNVKFSAYTTAGKISYEGIL